MSESAKIGVYALGGLVGGVLLAQGLRLIGSLLRTGVVTAAPLIVAEVLRKPAGSRRAVDADGRGVGAKRKDGAVEGQGEFDHLDPEGLASSAVAARTASEGASAKVVQKPDEDNWLEDSETGDVTGEGGDVAPQHEEIAEEPPSMNEVEDLDLADGDGVWGQTEPTDAVSPSEPEVEGGEGLQAGDGQEPEDEGAGCEAAEIIDEPEAELVEGPEADGIGEPEAEEIGELETDVVEEAEDTGADDVGADVFEEAEDTGADDAGADVFEEAQPDAVAEFGGEEGIDEAAVVEDLEEEAEPVVGTPFSAADLAALKSALDGGTDDLEALLDAGEVSEAPEATEEEGLGGLGESVEEPELDRDEGAVELPEFGLHDDDEEGEDDELVAIAPDAEGGNTEPPFGGLLDDFEPAVPQEKLLAEVGEAVVGDLGEESGEELGGGGESAPVPTPFEALAVDAGANELGGAEPGEDPVAEASEQVGEEPDDGGEGTKLTPQDPIEIFRQGAAEIEHLESTSGAEPKKEVIDLPAKPGKFGASSVAAKVSDELLSIADIEEDLDLPESRPLFVPSGRTVLPEPVGERRPLEKIGEAWPEPGELEELEPAEDEPEPVSPFATLESAAGSEGAAEPPVVNPFSGAGDEALDEVPESPLSGFQQAPDAASGDDPASELPRSSGALKTILLSLLVFGAVAGGTYWGWQALLANPRTAAAPASDTAPAEGEPAPSAPDEKASEGGAGNSPASAAGASAVGAVADHGNEETSRGGDDAEPVAPPKDSQGNNGQVEAVALGDDQNPAEPSETTAQETVEKFLAAADWQERITYVHREDVDEEEFSAFYQERGDAPFDYVSVTETASGKVPGTERETYLFSVVTEGRPNGIVVSIEETPDGYRLDWRGFVQFAYGLLEEFAADPTAGPGSFYVAAKRSHFFGSGVPDTDTKVCVRLISPIDPNSEIYAFAEEGTLAAEFVKGSLRWGTPYRPVVELEWTGPRGGEWVRLKAVKRMTWRATGGQ